MDSDIKSTEEGIYKDIQTFAERLFRDSQDISEAGDAHVAVQKGSSLSNILGRLNGMVSSDSPKRKSPDVYNLVSALSLSLRGYISLLPQSSISSLADRVNVETVNWLAQLFKYENVNGYFHDNRLDGLLRVSKLALYLKYAKYASDGFTALYTRPPVIYISAAAPATLGKDLKTHLGLPQSSICMVPCNSMFGSPYTMDVTAFERLLTDDVSCGKTPLLLIGYAGTPLAGHTDNLSRLREVCTQSGVWLHVEGDSLTSLALNQVPASVSAASNADSATLDIGTWFGMHSLPFCTLYRTSNIEVALSVGLVSSSPLEILHCLPLWVAFQFMGVEDLHKIISHATEISQQLCDRIDNIIGLKRIEQTNTTSPVVLFKYRASPDIRSDSLSSQDDDDGDDNMQNSMDAKNQGNKMQPLTTINITPQMVDELNRLILKEINDTDVFETVTLIREGLCIKFNPYYVFKTGPVIKDDIDKVISKLEAIVNQLDASLVLKSKFDEVFSKVSNAIIVKSEVTASIGAFQCVPNYWKTTDVSNLSDSKKREANSLNSEVLEKLSLSYDNLTLLKNTTGQNYISVGFSCSAFDLNKFVDDLISCLEELEDNSMFLESVSEAVQKSILEAEERLHKESEEKLLEGGILRLVPVVGSFYNWLSPPPKDDLGVTGRSFHIAKGKLETTEKTYKLKMQVTEEESNREAKELSNAQVSQEAAPSLTQGGDTLQSGIEEQLSLSFEAEKNSDEAVVKRNKDTADVAESEVEKDIEAGNGAQDSGQQVVESSEAAATTDSIVEDNSESNPLAVDSDKVELGQTMFSDDGINESHEDEQQLSDKESDV